MNRALQSLLISTWVLSCAGAAAAEKMKPGLWEMTMQSDMLKSIPNIPPEQMEKMRQMGIQIPQMKDGAVVTQICVTKEMAELDQVPDMKPQETGCQAANYQRAGSSYSVDIVCDSPQMKGRGKVKGQLAGSEQFTSTYDFSGTVHGQPTKQHYESSGKWINADCGNVAPPAGIAGKQKK